MDVKKLIRDFRRFQLERQKAKLVTKKMSSNFTAVLFRRRSAEELILDEHINVAIKVQQGFAILFKNQYNEPVFFLETHDIVSFDDGEPDSADEGEQPAQPALTVTLTINEAAPQSITLDFPNLQHKRNFIRAISAFLELSTSDSDSGMSS